jgi:UDP-N-acetylmuramoyl-L-alanyl-D-glutamate--2,6-diaminopimelate ligase
MNARGLVKKLIPSGLFPAVEPYGHLAEAVVLNVVNGFPARGLKVIGVTGTNGKTTTTYMIHRMLVQAGYKAGLMTTVAYGAGEDIRPQIHHMTNVPVGELMQRLKWMKAQGVEWLVLETTSHALAQNRVWGIPYSLAVMTNVTHEHLDYHKTFERYRDAKRKLFKLAARNTGGMQTGIVNADDPSAELFMSDVPRVITYSIEGAAPPERMADESGKPIPGAGVKAYALDWPRTGNGGQLRASSVESTSEGSTFTATYAVLQDPNTPGIPLGGGGEVAQNRVARTLKLHVNIPGQFNVANALAAACAGISVGLSDEQIEQGIAALEGVEGRMTTINGGQDFSVIVDFAHTPDSFEKLFKDLQPVVKRRGGRLIVMLGSAGRRDEAKRAVQGELAGRYADIVVVTEEDDRDIDGLEIMNQIAAGAESAGKVRDRDLFLVHDRTEAINFAVGQARPGTGDTVLLLGKGHEKTIERANGENPWDEIGTARAAVRPRQNS